MQTVVDRPDAPVAPAAGRARRTTRGTDHRVAWALAFVVVAGAVLRFWGLGANRLNYDDAFTTMAGRLPIGDLFAYLARARLTPAAGLPPARAAVARDHE